MAAGIEVRNLTKVFDDGRERVTAVDDASFSIREGELFSLLGESGCGKTTTLRMVAGLEPATSGSILFSGEDVTHLPANRRGIGMVFQSYALYPHMTVFENVAYGLRVRGVGRRQVRARVDEALAIVDLPAARFAARRPGELSGGEKQRVALARSLVYDPRLLLFDEPLSNLDAKLKVYMREEIRKVQQRSGITAIYVTHDQEEALSISDRVAVMFRGSISQVGAPVEIYDAPATAYVADFIGNANLFAATLTALDSACALAETAAGETIRGTARNEACRPGERVRVMIRPERIAMTAAQPVVVGTGPDDMTPTERNALWATIAAVTYLGSRTRYVLHTRFDAHLTVDSVRMIEGAAPGTDVMLTFDPADVLFLPSSTEAR